MRDWASPSLSGAEPPIPILGLSPLPSPGPHFVAVNNKNEIVVTDFHNHSVKVSTATAGGGGVCWHPWLCAVPHWCRCRVPGQPAVTPSPQVYNADGEFLFKFGSHGEGNGQFNAPTGVAVDANGNIIVADWGNSRIQVPAPQPHAALGGEPALQPTGPLCPTMLHRSPEVLGQHRPCPSTGSGSHQQPRRRQGL